MGKELASPMQSTPGNVALHARRQMLLALNRSQEAEHNFYADCRAAIGDASGKLAEFFSSLIQDELIYWGVDECKQFAAKSGIELDLISKWRALHAKLEDARAEHDRAIAGQKIAEIDRKKLGGLFGAKTGMEKEYKLASEYHDATRKHVIMARATLLSAKAEATKSATALLEECMKRAAAIAERCDSRVAVRPIEILTEAANRANALAAAHQVLQAGLNKEIRLQLDILDRLVGVNT
jgi:hypothetical protein